MQLSRRRQNALRSRMRKSRGVSLLEVLISILLSAVGLLALAGANVASIRYSKMSQYRGTASALASDLAERIRANRGGIGNYTLTADFSTQDTAMVTAVANEVAGTVDVTCETYSVASCNAGGLAAYDLSRWRLLVRDQLPQGAAFISIVTIGGVQSAADVWVVWRDPAVADQTENSTESRNAAADTAKECPNGLSLGADRSVRCSFFRINV